jgi:hypothetical protein
MLLQRISGVLQGNLATIKGIVLTLTDFPFLLEEIYPLCPQHCSLVGPWLPSQPSAIYVFLFFLWHWFVLGFFFFRCVGNPSMSEGPRFLLGNGPVRHSIKGAPRVGVQYVLAEQEAKYDKAHYALAENYSCLTGVIYLWFCLPVFQLDSCSRVRVQRKVPFSPLIQIRWPCA